MAPKRSVKAMRNKRKTERETIKVKKEPIAKHEKCTVVLDLAFIFRMLKRTVYNKLHMTKGVLRPLG